MSDINYQCTVVKIDNLHPLEGLDRLQGTNIFGNQVLVGKETQIGDTGLFFVVESQLGEQFCKANDLIRRKDEQGKTCGGIFDINRRVRCQKFRGHASMGFYISSVTLIMLDNINTWDIPEVGESFNELCGYEISKKYIPKTNRNNHTGLGKGVPKKRISRVIPEYFPEHIDTEHLFRNLHQIKEGNLLIFTWKLHGTSARCGNVLTKKKRTLWDKLFFRKEQQVYDYLYGSRQVIKNEFDEIKSGYYANDLWTSTGEFYFKDKLHPNEIIFYEIVGYVPGTQQFIQKGYTYGCSEGKCEVYVYRITKDSHDYSWEAIKERCTELGVKYVPELFSNMFPDITDIKESFYFRRGENLENHVKEHLLEKDEPLQPEMPSEGVVCRVEGLYPKFYKVKSLRFLELETKNLDQEVLDIEQQESNERAE